MNTTTYIGVESIAIKVPSVEQLDLFTRLLSPWIAICQWRKQRECSDAERQEQNNQSSANLRSVFQSKRRDSVRPEVVDLAKSHDGEV